MLCLSSDHCVFMVLLMVFNWWTDSSLIFEHCSKLYNFSIAIFLLLHLDKICSQVHIVTIYYFYVLQ